MQVVSSLLSLQAKKIQDRRVSEAFEVGQTRVMAMALIHEILYQSASLADIDMERYVTKLSDGLFRGYGADRHRITLKVRSDVIDLGLDYAVPFGLVVNELVSNAFKHAFPDQRTGEISIDAKKIDGKGVRLVVADNGVGIPPDMDLHNQRGLGLQLVTSLVENQLNGTLDLDRTEGTKITVAFELGQYKSRI
jgi:two-component sensor histidine kinase